MESGSHFSIIFDVPGQGTPRPPYRLFPFSGDRGILLKVVGYRLDVKLREEFWGGEVENLCDIGGVGKEHGQTVNADSDTGAGGQIAGGADEFLVIGVGG